MSDPCLRLRGLRRDYPGVRALDGVDLDLHAGRVHALVGENGAGKSTLIGILAGTVHPHAGTVDWVGEPGRLAVVHQHSHLLPDLTIAENYGLRAGLPRGALGGVDGGALEARCARALAPFIGSLSPRAEAGRLGAVERQLVELALALDGGAPAVLVLDEPTAVLPRAETRLLLQRVDHLRAAGTAVLYISHRLSEVLELADDITVLRDGRVVAADAASHFDEAGLVRAMVGRDVAAGTASPPPGAGDELLTVDGLSVAGGPVLSFAVRAGEVVGVYGLGGAGQDALSQGLLGLLPGTATVLRLAGTDLRALAPRQRVAAGLSVLPADRLARGLLYDLTLAQNLSLANLPHETGPGGWIDLAGEAERAAADIEALGVRARGPAQAVGELSGGNQQKVLLGRWLRTAPRLLVLQEPTQGVDVAAKAQIHQRIRDLAAGGVAVLLVSGELPEVLALGHRVLVLRDGAISGQVRLAPGDGSRGGPGESSAAAASPALLASAGTSVPALARAAAEEEVLRLALPEHPSATAAARPVMRGTRRSLGLGLAVAALALLAALTTPAFRAPGNLVDLLVNNTILLVGALSATVVIVAGAIDISLGAILGLAAVTAAQVDGGGASTPTIALAAVLAGAGLGWLNGALSVWGRVHAVVITLGTMSLYRGAMLQWTGGRWLVNLSAQLTDLGQGRLLGVPAALWLAAAAAVAVHRFLRHTRAGRGLYAVGSDAARAQVSGVDPRRALLLAFAVAGALAGLAGLLQAARYGQVQSNAGIGFELRAIAAAVIGGVSISGGRGRVGGVLLGTLLLGLVANLMVLWHVSAYWEGVVVGLALLLALAADGVFRREADA